MIPKPFPYTRSRVVAATDPSSSEMYGAPYQTLIWASILGDDFLDDLVELGGLSCVM